MDYFGINSAEDLPKIREVLADQIVEGTMINPEDFTDQNVATAISEELADEETNEEVSAITVNEDGELIIKEEEKIADEEENAATDPEKESDADEDSHTDTTETKEPE